MRIAFIIMGAGAMFCSCSETDDQKNDGKILFDATADRATGSDVKVERMNFPDTSEVDISSSGCKIFPDDNPWNTDISDLPVHPNSGNFIASMGVATGIQADFGTEIDGVPIGIPYVVVPGDQKLVPIEFVVSPSESEPGPYPIPLDAPIEGGLSGVGSRTVIAVDMTNCMLYELHNAFPVVPGWRAANGAQFNLRSNTLRPLGWTSADAAGLPIFPGLVRYDEAEAGAINHALRFSVSNPQKAYVLPARHFSSENTDPHAPPFGLRLRLKASFNTSSFSGHNQVILTALKKYGMFVATIGADWFLSGAPDSRWNDANLKELGLVTGGDFEVVDTGPIHTSY